ncbi:MAG: ketol-acid reductoisomerase [Anaerolineae bacterium]
MTVVYYEQDANIQVLAGKSVGVIGYTQQGRLAALNLRDSGVQVIVSGSDEEQISAQADGFTVGTIRNVTQQADILLLALPDEQMTEVYMQHISPHLRRGDTLIFSSAYNIAFGFVEPPPFVDVGMIAPRTAGGEPWLENHSFLSFVAVWQDASRSAWQTVLAVARGMGALRLGALEIKAQQEAELTLFIQQAVLPVFHHVIVAASRLLIDQGYPTEAALIDLYLSGRFSNTLQQAAQRGLWQTLENTNLIGQYGTFSRLDRFDDLKLERLMEITLEQIRTGDFAREWAREYADGQPRLKKLIKQQQTLDLWELEQQTLDLLDEDSELF